MDAKRPVSTRRADRAAEDAAAASTAAAAPSVDYAQLYDVVFARLEREMSKSAEFLADLVVARLENARMNETMMKLRGHLEEQMNKRWQAEQLANRYRVEAEEERARASDLQVRVAALEADDDATTETESTVTADEAAAIPQTPLSNH